MKVALVYDRINKWGGAERVLLAFHEMFPEAPLYTSVYNEKKAPWASVFPKIHTSFLQKFPFAKSHHELYASLMPLAFESFNFDKYDLAISVTSEAAKGIITKPGTAHVCYCLTPTRYLWSGYEDYFRNPVFKFITFPVVWYLKAWDKIAARRPDKIVAISKEVQKRIKKYYGLSSEVIYPPVTINGRRSKVKNDSGYFLIVSRLVPYKRIDVTVKAFNKLGLPLKIVGTGSEFKKLKRMAKSNIEFLGNLTDEELVSYYKDCIALVFPGIEDFGLTVLEAQSFGKPVIAYKKGGAEETVVEGQTGLFFYPQTEKALIKKVKEFKNLNFDAEKARKQARKFGEKEFIKKFLDILK